MERSEFVNYIFSKENLIDSDLVPIIVLAIQVSDEYVKNTKSLFTKSLAYSSFNVVYKFYHDYSENYFSYKKHKSIEFDIIMNIKEIPRLNFLTKLMSLCSDNEFEQLNGMFVYFMMKDLCKINYHEKNEKILIIAMILLHKRRKLRFYQEYVREKAMYFLWQVL